MTARRLDEASRPRIPAGLEGDAMRYDATKLVFVLYSTRECCISNSSSRNSNGLDTRSSGGDYLVEEAEVEG